MKPNIVLITQFEPVDSPGEFSRFREGLGLEKIADSCLPDLLFANREGSVLAVIAGVGAVQTATRITALGLDSRFDLSQALWIISGIAGGDPARCALGSVALANWCIDGDLAWEIDGRELPPSWPTGILPLGANAPYESPAENGGVFGIPYQKVELPKSILRWAEEAAKNTPLATDSLAHNEGERYRELPGASADPGVQVGAILSAVRFWHGSLMNQWAREWVDFFTSGEATFLASSMEDSGTLYAFRYLCERGLAHPEQILLIRAISNFTCPPSGESAVSTLLDHEEEAHMPGYDLALENGYRVTSSIIRRWLSQADPASRDA